jgi:hypothetical protein
MSISDSEDKQNINANDLQRSGQTNTQRVANNDGDSSDEKDDNGGEDDDKEEGLRLPDPISFSPNCASQGKSPDSAVPRHFSAFAPNSRRSEVGPHRNPSSRRSSTAKSPINAPSRVGSRSASGSSLQDQLSRALDPASREERDNQKSLVRFYSMQLRDANKTIEKLRDKILRLQSGDQKKVTDVVTQP